MNEELQKTLKYLRLWSLLANWDDLLQRARRGKFSHERLLKLVLEEECRNKNDNARTLRRKRARIPELLEIETYPFTRQPKLDRKRIMSLYDSLDYMTKRQNIIWLGPTGCGKTGLATSFLLHAIDAGYRGYVGIEYEGGSLSEAKGIAATKALLEKVREELAAAAAAKP